MTEVWRPLDVTTEDQIASYDALHDGVPHWMEAPYWQWVREALTVLAGERLNNRWPMLDVVLWEAMCQTLRIRTPDLRTPFASRPQGREQLDKAIDVARNHSVPLQVADYLLAQGGHAKAAALSTVLQLSKSAFEVGKRAGHPSLMRRVPAGVQAAANSVIERAGRAGERLAKAWESLYGLTPDASAAYRLAILAVEDAAVPVVSPQNPRATLGTVLRQMEDQANWGLPMTREHGAAGSAQVLIGMLRLLWHGQHDRHGGQPSAPGDVSNTEAQVAVSLAVTLVAWFDGDLVRRGGPGGTGMP